MNGLSISKKILCALATAALIISGITTAAASPEPGPDSDRTVSQNATCRGMTWTQRRRSADQTHTFFASHISTDAYRGDTNCREKRPILCLKKENLPLPPGLVVTFYSGWTGGTVKISKPVEGSRLTSRAKADSICAKEFGAGYVIGEHHDGDGGWGWWAQSEGWRLWVKPGYQAETTTPVERVQTWTVLANEWNSAIMTFGADLLTDAPDRREHPVLCFNQPPGYAGPVEARFSRWVTGEDARKNGDRICSRQFGASWQMANTYLGGAGKNFPVPAQEGRLWTAINDQPANPWNSR